MENTKSKPSDAFKITSSWAEESKALKAKYSQLTDEDLKCVAGKEEELITKLSTKLKMKHDEVVSILKKGHPSKA